MLPRPALDHALDGRWVYAILTGQCAPVFRAPGPDLDYELPGQLGLVVLLAAARRAVTAFVQVVLRPGAVTDIRQARIGFTCRAMPYLLARRAASDERQRNKYMNMPSRALTILKQGDRWVPVPVRPGQELSAALPPEARLGAVAPATDAPYPAKAADLVQALVARDGQPPFGSIVHSRTPAAVRPGRCLPEHGRADVLLPQFYVRLGV